MCACCFSRLRTVRSRGFANGLQALIFVLGLSTNPDPMLAGISMLAMFVPLYVLYEISVVLARFVQPKRVDAPVVEDSGGAPA